MEIKTTERGWAGHYICSDRCKFRRNTLIEYGDTRVVVSTVGAFVIDGKFDMIGADRWYETMAFYAKKEGEYWEADVSRVVDFDSEWGLFAGSQDELVEKYKSGIDNIANDMHDAVVSEIRSKMLEGSI